MKEESSLVFCLPQRRVVPAENYPVKRPGEVPSGVAGWTTDIRQIPAGTGAVSAWGIK